MPAGKARPPKPVKGSNIRFGFESFKNVAIRPGKQGGGRGGGGKAHRESRGGGGGGKATAAAAREKANIATTLDWSAWQRIYNGLWNGATDADVNQALADLAAWQQAALRRREPALFPAYAAATLEVATVAMSASPPAAASSSSSGTPPEVLVHAYAGAITRAVVELTERDSLAKASASRAGASTYRQRAAAIELPSEVTEVRNLAAHGRNPPLSQLRWAAMILLAHLRREYWDAQRQQLGAVKEHQRAHAEEERARAEQKRLDAVDRAAAAVTTASSDAQPALSLDALRSRLSGLGSVQSKATGGVAAAAKPAPKAPITTWT